MPVFQRIATGFARSGQARGRGEELGGSAAVRPEWEKRGTALGRHV
jgi:hypothetical protein